ncbi:hypothetical protein BDC45DRAFT_484442 [Circinella umbellata]|nr:hypothetical protein BDC45DRAFT_484442 [Circinella umbellata]
MASAAAVVGTTSDPPLLNNKQSLNSSDTAAESMRKHQQEQIPNIKLKEKYPARKSSQEDGLQQQVQPVQQPNINKRPAASDDFPTQIKYGANGSLPTQIASLPENVSDAGGPLPDNVHNTSTSVGTKNNTPVESEVQIENEKDQKEDDDTLSECFKLRFPQPLRPVKPNQLIQGLELNALKYLVITCFTCYFFGRLHGGYFFGFVSIFVSAMAYWLLGTESQEGVSWQLEKQEGAKTLYDTRGETVEWMNYFLEKIWRSIDPNVFVIVEDILEDTLESLAPAVIKTVKVTDLDIGVHAPRISQIRIFPPMPGQPDEAMFGEAAFIFQSSPTGMSSSALNKSTSTPPGIGVRFKTGLKTPIDIKAQLVKVRGKLRFKILTSPDMPFVSKVTISFVDVPIVETNVMPISKHMNVMKLPMMQSLVNEAVKLGFAGLVDPKSMTLDIKELIGAATQDTSAIGVVKVEVRQARRNATLDLKDMKDAYATISISSQEDKSTTSTRVLTNDENPRWNENLYILIRQEEIVNEATVDLKVYDADKVKPDDSWGCASISVKDIVCGKIDKLDNVIDWCKQERTVFDGWAPLDDKNDLEESKVKLDFRMTFHPKYVAPPPPTFMTMLERNKMTKEQKELEEEEWNPIHKSGILSVVITEAADLEIGDPEMITCDEFKHPYNSHQIVNPYAVIYLNDTKVYETRAKLRNPSPHWNADVEKLIKDYDSAFLRVSVKTNMDLERDPVLGTRVFYLKDVFENQQDKFKETERWVALANGIGFGKISLNLKYKPVKLFLPRELRGSDVGTMIVDRVQFKNLKRPFSTHYMRSTKVTLALNVDPVILKRLKHRDLIKQQSDEMGHNNDMMVWQKDRPLYFPLSMRYRTALYVYVNQGSIYTNKAMGRLWLKSVCDGSWQEATIGLYDYMRPDDCNKNEDDWSPDDNLYGQVVVRFKIVPGFSPVHTHLRSFQLDMLGADPFHDEALRHKVEQWVEEANDQEQNERVREEDERRRESYNTEISEVYGDEEQEADKEFLEDLQKYKVKNRNIPRLFVFRKLSRGTDALRHHVQTVREGFNSENRASRSVKRE